MPFLDGCAKPDITTKGDPVPRRLEKGQPLERKIPRVMEGWMWVRTGTGGS